MPDVARFDHAAAMAFYLGLDPPRTYQRVADQFGVTGGAIRKIAKREGWLEEAAKIDEAAIAKALTQGARTRDQRVAAVLKLVDKVIDKTDAGIDSGTVELKASDAPQYVKLAELLEGEATDRVSVPELQGALRMVLGLARQAIDGGHGYEWLLARFEVELGSPALELTEGEGAA